MIMTNNNLEDFQESNFSNNEIYSVTEFSYAIKKLVEGNFTYVKIKGEVFRPSFPNSGHVYFTLKDQDSSISAVIWRYTMPRLKLKPEEGMEVICSGKITTFSGQSRYQIIIDEIELAGQGALLKKLEERRQKFLEEGLFKSENKKNIPLSPLPSQIPTPPIFSTVPFQYHTPTNQTTPPPTAVRGHPQLLQLSTKNNALRRCLRRRDARRCFSR